MVAHLRAAAEIEVTVTIGRIVKSGLGSIATAVGALEQFGSTCQLRKTIADRCMSQYFTWQDTRRSLIRRGWAPVCEVVVLR
jgi:hypothetical protein